ncbi:MAG TPA: hypothetical protein VFE53_00245 [Mucilaginibacter sp.]|jgi:hypothetical protein|nr:hypothetical protein [Mucilaginibacter sp.]
MKLLLTFIAIVLCGNVLAQKKERILFPPPVFGEEYPEYLNACDLLTHKNQFVYTRFIYSGTDEYWGLQPESKCVNINAELNIPDTVALKKEDMANLKAVHKRYWKEYLVIDVMGTLVDTDLNGYGHLGSNKYRFTVKYFIDSYLVKKEQ